MDRRHFFKHAAFFTGASLFTPGFQGLFSWAQAGSTNPHFFIFAFARGGWDVTMVFEPKVGLDTIDVDPDGEVMELHGIPFLHNTEREAVLRFFTDFGDRSCVVNGINTRSVSHSVGTEIMMTGSAGMNAPDWPTLIAAENGAEQVLPHLAISGPVFSGVMGQGTASGAGFFNLLLGGETSSATFEQQVDHYLQRRMDQARWSMKNQGRTGSRALEMNESFGRWKELRSLKSELGFGDLNSFADEGIALASAFQRGFSSTGSLRTPGGWDSHSNNNGRQSSSFQSTFDEVYQITDFLANQTGTSGTGTLLDQTTLVVMSEMGRTPKLNNSNGKDHWPYTSVLLVGGGIKGAQVVGATDEFQNGEKVNMQTGQLDPNGEIITAGSLGWSLLSIAGVDPALFLPPDTTPLTAILA